MKQAVIQNFLNLPGLAGVALMNGRSRPYFHGFSQPLGQPQREALAQGIQQVIDTTPADFQSFEFRFSEHQVYVYKLDLDMTLLVVAYPGLVFATYAARLEQVKEILKDEADGAMPGHAIAAFQAMALAQPNPNTIIQPPDSDFSSISLKETLTVINRLSKLATQYLGTIVVINYWKNSRPEADWLKLFQIERSAQVIFSGQADTLVITTEQHQWLQAWIAAFIKRCSRVIRDFPKMVSQMPLDDNQRAILLLD
jgi:hypothetical protein